MGFLKSKVRSTNTQSDWLYDQYKPVAEGLLSQGQSGLGSYLGQLQGTDNGQGFRQFQQSTGYNNILGDAMRGVSGSAAARGLLNSGSTARALQTRAAQLGQQSYGNYLQQLLGGSQASLQGGFSAGQGVADMGAQNKRVGGLGGILNTVGQIGQAAGAFASLSDPRLKENVQLLGKEADGLGIYSFNYIGDDKAHVGVMADEVAELRPYALGPEVDGYKSVRYDRLDG